MVGTSSMPPLGGMCGGIEMNAVSTFEYNLLSELQLEYDKHLADVGHFVYYRRLQNQRNKYIIN